MTYTAIFMIIVFAIIMIGGIAAGTGMLSSSRASTTTSEVAQIVANVDGAYAQQATFAGLSNTVAIAGKLVPSNMVQGANILNPYGGAVTLGPDATVANGFDVTNAGLGNSACASVAEQESAYEIEINGTVVATSGQSVSPTTAAQDCTSGPGANTVTIVDTQTSG